MVTQTVVFDVGESLIDEARMWAGWARWLGVTLPTFLAALDDAIAGGRHHHEALRRFRPSLDVEVARRRRTARAAGMVAVFLERGPWGARMRCGHKSRWRMCTYAI